MQRQLSPGVHRVGEVLRLRGRIEQLLKALSVLGEPYLVRLATPIAVVPSDIWFSHICSGSDFTGGS